MNEELKFLRKFQKKSGRWSGGQVGGQVDGGLRVDLNGMLGVRGDVGYGGCEPRIEGIAQCTKGYCTILRQLKKCWGEGEGQCLNPKHSFLKKKNKKKIKKKLTEPGLEPTTYGLAKTCSLIH